MLFAGMADTKASTYFYLAVDSKMIKENNIRAGAVFLRATSDSAGVLKVKTIIEREGMGEDISAHDWSALDAWVDHVNSKREHHDEFRQLIMASLRDFNSSDPGVMRAISRIELAYGTASKKVLCKEKDAAAARKDKALQEVLDLMDEYSLAVLDGDEDKKVKLRNAIVAYV